MPGGTSQIESDRNRQGDAPEQSQQSAQPGRLPRREQHPDAASAEHEGEIARKEHPTRIRHKIPRGQPASWLTRPTPHGSKRLAPRSFPSTARWCGRKPMPRHSPALPLPPCIGQSRGTAPQIQARSPSAVFMARKQAAPARAPLAPPRDWPLSSGGGRRGGNRLGRHGPRSRGRLRLPSIRGSARARKH